MPEVIHTNTDPKVRDHIQGLMGLLDPTGQRRSTDDTPKRVSRMFLTELCAGYYINVEQLFQAVFPDEGAGGMVVVHNIPFYSLCEHHWLLITGKAHIGYLPDGQVLGLSKIARVLDAYARRFQLQERVSKQVADALEKHLHPRGVIVVIEAEHHCLSIRGAQKSGTITTTCEVRGVFEDRTSGFQEEFFRHIR